MDPLQPQSKTLQAIEQLHKQKRLTFNDAILLAKAYGEDQLYFAATRYGGQQLEPLTDDKERMDTKP